MADESLTNCPLCAATVRADARDCHSCGVIFAKLREKWEREKAAAAAAVEAAEAPLPAIDPRLTPMRLRLAASAIVAVWMLFFGLYYRVRVTTIARAHTTRSRLGQESSRFLLRDPGTGRPVGVEVHLSPSAPTPRVEPPAREEAPPPGAPKPDSNFDD